MNSDSDDQLAMAIAETEGREAYNVGLAIKHNPYHEGTNVYHTWNMGWRRSRFFDHLETEGDKVNKETLRQLAELERITASKLFGRGAGA